MQSIHTVAFDLIQQVKEIAVTVDKSLVISDQCLQLFPHGDSRHYWYIFREDEGLYLFSHLGENVAQFI